MLDDLSVQALYCIVSVHVCRRMTVETGYGAGPMYRPRELAVSTCLLVLAATGCTTVTNEPAPSVSLDETVFKTKVERILVAQCSYVACHGNPGSALRVYAPGLLRAAPAANLSDAQAPLTADEEHAKFLSAAAFSTTAETPADNWLLRKPLPSTFGGFEHKGGAIFKSPNDASYAAIYCWLTGATSC
jgi:hypothetical protein